MTTASTYDYRASEQMAPRILTFFGILLSNGGAFFVLLFWSMGAGHLLTNNGGLINLLQLEGIMLTLFWAYPVVVVLSLSAWLFYLFRMDKIALPIAAAPIGLFVIYYLYLVFFYSF